MIRTAALTIKDGYRNGAKRLAAGSVQGLARTRVSPNALTAAGVGLCAVAAVLVYFSDRNEYLFYWLAGSTFLAGSILDLLDGALARHAGTQTPFGGFLDSTIDRIGEGVVLAAAGLVFAREGNELALAFAFAAIAGSFLVSYTRAKAEVLGLRGDVGLGTRAERVTVITAGLFLAPFGVLEWAVYLLTATAWVTVVHRVLHVRNQLRSGGTNGFQKR
jgi:CDP-diacylglycerol--glycerol-3-phosphate 3-phosphatidyltransferase